MAEAQKPPLKRRVLDELTEFSIIVGYVWMMLVAFELHRYAIMRELGTVNQMDYRVGLALINALVLGKVILILEHVRFLDRFKDERLVYSILFKSAVVAVILICFLVLEDTIGGLIHGKTLAQSIPQMGGGGLEGKLIAGLMMFVVLIPFFGFTEIRRVIGRENMRALLLAKKPLPLQTQPVTEFPQASATGKRMKQG